MAGAVRGDVDDRGRRARGRRARGSAEAAIASHAAAEAYGLEVVAEDVSDRNAYTRFVAVAPHTRIDGGVAWRTALWFVTDHRPGSLFRALEPFSRHGLNLVQLVSRPLPDSPWRYRFDAVLDGHVFDRTCRPRSPTSARSRAACGSSARTRRSPALTDRPSGHGGV